MQNLAYKIFVSTLDLGSYLKRFLCVFFVSLVLTTETKTCSNKNIHFFALKRCKLQSSEFVIAWNSR